MGEAAAASEVEGTLSDGEVEAEAAVEAEEAAADVGGEDDNSGATEAVAGLSKAHMAMLKQVNHSFFREKNSLFKSFSHLYATFLFTMLISPSICLSAPLIVLI